MLPQIVRTLANLEKFVTISSRARHEPVPMVCYSNSRDRCLLAYSIHVSRYRSEGQQVLAATMTSKPPYYRIYLLTVWQEQSRGPPEHVTWRFRLEDPRTGRQQAFADAAALMTALEELTVSVQGEEKE